MDDTGLELADGIEAKQVILFDVETIDSNELLLGLGAEPGGLTTAQVRRIVDDLDAVANVVGITVAEFIPRQVMHLQQLLTAFPLLRASTHTKPPYRGGPRNKACSARTVTLPGRTAATLARDRPGSCRCPNAGSA